MSLVNRVVEFNGQIGFCMSENPAVCNVQLNNDSTPTLIPTYQLNPVLFKSHDKLMEFPGSIYVGSSLDCPSNTYIIDKKDMVPSWLKKVNPLPVGHLYCWRAYRWRTNQLHISLFGRFVGYAPDNKMVLEYYCTTGLKWVKFIVEEDDVLPCFIAKIDGQIRIFQEELQIGGASNGSWATALESIGGTQNKIVVLPQAIIHIKEDHFEWRTEHRYKHHQWAFDGIRRNPIFSTGDLVTDEFGIMHIASAMTQTVAAKQQRKLKLAYFALVDPMKITCPIRVYTDFNGLIIDREWHTNGNWGIVNKHYADKNIHLFVIAEDRKHYGSIVNKDGNWELTTSNQLPVHLIKYMQVLTDRY